MVALFSRHACTLRLNIVIIIPFLGRREGTRWSCAAHAGCSFTSVPPRDCTATCPSSLTTSTCVLWRWRCTPCSSLYTSPTSSKLLGSWAAHGIRETVRRAVGGPAALLVVWPSSLAFLPCLWRVHFSVLRVCTKIWSFRWAILRLGVVKRIFSCSKSLDKVQNW